MLTPLLAVSQPSLPSGQESNPDSIRQANMPQIEVIGQIDRFLRIPGSAKIVPYSAITRTAPVSGHEVFRRVTGLHAVEEEGIGMRANIGIRGLDPDKSRTVLMMEDGVPIALAPYGEPEMYYTPAMDRMSGVEVLKGSGSILFGPQTFGGVINYLTANPPPVPTTTALVRGGEGGFFVGKFGYGTTVGNTGFQATYLRKHGDKVGLLNYGINDLNTKIKMVLAPNSIIGVKLGVYDEQSNSTYVGLSQAMYDSGLYDFTHLAPDDNLSVRRYSGSVTHDYFFSDNLRLKTTAFAYTTTRNWSRQDFANTPSGTATYIRTVGDTTTTGGALYFLDRTGNRNRQFEVLGFEPRLSANYLLLNTQNELDMGFRVLFERAFEQRVDGNVARPTSGTLREDEIRTGRAISGYIQNRIYLNPKFTATPGLRVEYFTYERDILRLSNQPQTAVKDDQLVEVIPGLGFNYILNEQSSVFAGIHRGFGPPRVKDAISRDAVTGNGISEELDAEKSWNMELGSRVYLMDGLFTEITLFYLNFTNQVLPVSESSGGQGVPGSAGLTNGGETEHKGLEWSLEADFGTLFQSAYRVSAGVNTTYTIAEFSGDRFVQSGGIPVNVKGNTLPYAPKVLVNGSLDVAAPQGFYVGISGMYIAKQYGDVLNTKTGSLNGRNGELPAYFVVDGQFAYTAAALPFATFSINVKNLLDERYIVSRRPQGIRVGLPRFVTAGVELKF